MPDKTTEMQIIAQELQQLSSSPLYALRQEKQYKPVVGEGSLEARILFIGEAPGEQEAKTGRPFVGASGRMLDTLLESVDLKRADVYITNIVKDRPPENRDPSPDEIALYTPFLVRQIQLIRPQVIVTLGRFAMDFILGLYNMPQAGQKISQLHGQLLQAQTEGGELWVLPLFHPAVALYNRGQRQTLELDFQALKQFGV